MEIWSVVQEELERYASSVLAIRHCLFAYERKCSSLIEKISLESFEEAQEDFDLLYEIQHELAQIKYKYEFKLTDRLDGFVYHLERDDSCSRKFWYKKFKEGKAWPEDE